MIVLEAHHSKVIEIFHEICHRLAARYAAETGADEVAFRTISRQVQVKDFFLEQLAVCRFPLGLLHFWRLIQPNTFECHQNVLNCGNVVQRQPGEVSNFLDMIPTQIPNVDGLGPARGKMSDNHHVPNGLIGTLRVAWKSLVE